MASQQQQTDFPWNDTCDYNIVFSTRSGRTRFQQLSTFYILIPALLCSALIYISTRRKRLWPTLFSGRPGIAVPVYFLDERLDRRAIVAVFCMATSIFIAMVTQSEMRFKWDYPDYLRPLMVIVVGLIFATSVYPLVAAISCRSAIGYTIGSVYLWIFGLVQVLCEWPCFQNTTGSKWSYMEVTLHSLGLLPFTLCFIYLAVLLPLRAIRMFRNKPQHSDQHPMNKSLIVPDAHLTHVKNIYENPFHPQGIKAHIRSVAGFRISITVLIAISVSIVISYQFTIWVFGEYYLATHAYLAELDHAIDDFADRLLPPGFKLREDGFKAPKIFDMIGRTFLNREPPTFITKTLPKIKAEVKFWLPLFEIASYVSLGLGLLVNIASLLFGLRRYRYHMMGLYRGQYRGIPRYAVKWHPRSVLISAIRYIAYQIAFATWGYLLQELTVSVLVMGVIGFVVSVIRYKLWTTLMTATLSALPLIVVFLVVMLLQNLLVHFCFLQRAEDGRRVLSLNNRRLYYNFQFVMMFADLPLGFAACVGRILQTILLGAWVLPRLDVSTMPRSFENMDMGFGAYVCMLAVENAHTNPSMVVFCHLLLDALAHAPLIRPLADRRRRIVRNRWALYLTLHYNPSLRAHRRCAAHAPNAITATSVPLTVRTYKNTKLDSIMQSKV